VVATCAPGGAAGLPEQALSGDPLSAYYASRQDPVP